MQPSELRLQEIKYSIENKEIHRVTTGLMDFTRDYLEENPLLDRTIALRKKYNSARALGSSDISESDIHLVLNEATEIFNKLKDTSVKDIEEKLLSNYPKEELLIAKGIEKKYPKGNFKLGPVNTILRPGEITGIVGENGNGKTTLLRILARLLDYDNGELSYSLNHQSVIDNYELKHQIAYIPQRIERWNGTLKENLQYAASIHGIHGNENTQAVDFVIHRMGLSNFSNLSWSELSSGYKLRFELAKMLVWSPKILILDEPLANLDINTQQSMLQDFKHIARSIKNPVSIILSSQQLFEVEHVADRIIFLSNGTCKYSGKVEEFMQNREGNVFEIAGNFTVLELKQHFNNQDYYFAENGSSITVTTNTKVTSSVLLSELINSGYTIKYFRDISTSTKQLFKL